MLWINLVCTSPVQTGNPDRRLIQSSADSPRGGPVNKAVYSLATMYGRLESSRFSVSTPCAVTRLIRSVHAKLDFCDSITGYMTCNRRLSSVDRRIVVPPTCTGLACCCKGSIETFCEYLKVSEITRIVRTLHESAVKTLLLWLIFYPRSDVCQMDLEVARLSSLTLYVSDKAYLISRNIVL